ncbi:MAG: PD-(D/E)XK nuclease family protein [Planctomycetota bacterium]
MSETNDFLVTAIKGHYTLEDEDRLTQVFVACFNHSTLFRKIALRFFRFPKVSGAMAATQISSHDKKGRLDISIFDHEGHELGVIENKIDSVLTGRQLKKYKKAGHKTIVAITRKYPEIDENLGRFHIYRWSEFYSVLEDTRDGWTSSDRLLIGAFLQYLKEIEMTGLQEITRNDLIDAGKAISFLAKPSKAYASRSLLINNPFFVFNELTQYFQRVYADANKDPLLRKRIGKNFRFNPYLDMNEGTGKQEGLYVHPAVCFSFYTPWGGRSIKIAAVGLYYLIHPTDNRSRGFYVWRRYKVSDRYVEKRIDKLIFSGNVLSAEKLSDTAIKRWKIWLK